MKRPKPVALIILDGFGLRDEVYGNAVAQAHKPNYDKYWHSFPHAILQASGEPVGLPPGQVGNSEVGHLNIGAGRVVYQELTRVTKEVEDGCFFTNDTFLGAIRYAREHKSSVHLYGLLSDGGVHSHIKHLFALLSLMARENVQEVFVHAFLDGRDVSPESSMEYIKQLQAKMDELGVGKIATVQGRYFAMDRDNRWDRTEKSYRAMVYGEGVRCHTPAEAVQESYHRSVYDEFILPTVLVDEQDKPVGLIQDNDAVIFFNFRPDRAVQISLAFTNDDFRGFARGDGRPRNLYYVCLTKFSEIVQGYVAYKPASLDNTYGEVISQHGLKQLRIAETEKYPHVTYFFNGGREDPFPGEDRVLIPSPKVATYDLKPEMSAYEVADAFIKELEQDKYDTIILNFANPDMVGHSGKLEPTMQAIEAVDECLGRIVDSILKKGGVAIITADHGNADKELDENGRPFTAHTTSPVPCILTDESVTLRGSGVLADLAPTMLYLLGLSPSEEMTGKSLII